MLTKLIKYLNDICQMPAGLHNDICTYADIKEFKKAEFILREGSIANYTCWVIKGAARSYYIKENEEVTTKFILEGAPITSIYSYYSRRPGNENIVALEDITLAYFHYDQMQQMYKDYPEFNVIGRVITERYLLFSEIELYNLRKTKAEDRYRFFEKHYPQLLQRAPLKHIATYLGMNLETLSRIRARKK